VQLLSFRFWHLLVSLLRVALLAMVEQVLLLPRQVTRVVLHLKLAQVQVQVQEEEAKVR
jgi:hypothetical protein